MPKQVTSAANRLLASPWLRPLNDVDAVDDLLSRAAPHVGTREDQGARGADPAETPDVRSFVLRPNRRWPGFVAGQHVSVALEIRGVRHHRTYSLSSAPADRLLRITVKRHADGLVSNALHDRVAVGDVLELSAPSGSFVLPKPVPEKVLMLSAGSGITPVMSMLRDLRHRARIATSCSCTCAGRSADAILAAELRSARRVACRRCASSRTSPPSEAGSTPTASRRSCPTTRERETLMCGPAAFLETVQARWEADGLADRFACERFDGPIAAGAQRASRSSVRALRSKHSFTTTGERPLLVEAEAAGLAPKHGCRMGICRTCRCRMPSGSVENLRTGEISSEPGQLIQLCISVARSDLELEL